MSTATETHCWYTSRAGKRTGPYRVLWQGQTRYGNRCKLQFTNKNNPNDYFWADHAACDSFQQVMVNGNGQQPPQQPQSRQPLPKSQARPVAQQPSAPVPSQPPAPAAQPVAAPAVQQAFGYTMLPSHSGKRFAYPTRSLVDSRQGFTITDRIQQPDGSYKPVRKAFRTLPSSMGKLSEISFQLRPVVETRLTELEAEMDPKDFIGRLDSLDVKFSPDRMKASPIGNWPTLSGESVRSLYGGATPDFLFTTTGASQLQSYVLPGHFWSGFKRLVRLDPEGAETGSHLAYRVWKKFAAVSGDKERRLRTVKMKVDANYYRVVRSVVSKSYADYSNLDLVQDLIRHAGDYGRLPVLDWHVTDNQMRLRFYAMDNPAWGLLHLDEDAFSRMAVPMVEVWNGETGSQSIRLRGGAWRHETQTALGHWDNKATYRWYHSGRRERIQEELEIAFKAIVISAEEVAEAYERAQGIRIDGDVEDWTEKEITMIKGLPDNVLVEVKEGLKHPSTTSGGVLASVVDAICLAASKQQSLQGQETVENAASRILNRGLVIADKNGGVIPHKGK